MEGGLYFIFIILFFLGGGGTDEEGTLDVISAAGTDSICAEKNRACYRDTDERSIKTLNPGKL